VDTSRLNVLGDGVEQQLAVGSDSVDIDLLGTLNELGDDDGVVGGDSAGIEELLLQLVDTVDDAHGSTGQDVTRADQDGVSNSLGELLGLGDGGQLLPSGLVDANAIQDLRELVAVLGLVNVLRISAQDLGATSLLQTQGNILGQLATDRHNDTGSALEFVDIHHTLVAQLLEVQLVSGVKVSRVGLGVVVNHDSLLAHAAQGQSGIHSAPIELDGATDTVHTATQDESAMVIESDIVGGCVVGCVQVVGVRGEFSRQGINLLDPRGDAEGLAASANLVLRAANQERDLLVREAELLGLQHSLLLDAEQAADFLQLVVAVNDVLDLVQEPLVDLAQLVNPVNRVTLVKHSLADGQPAAISRVLQDVVEVLEMVTLKTNVPRVDLANGLLEGLLEGTANSHDLTNRLHGTANVAVDVLELAQIPAGDLGDNVIQRRLEVCGGGLGHSVGKLGQGVAETNLGSSVGQRVTGSLGGQSRRTRETSVDLNNTVVEAIGLQSVLDVTLANDAQVADNLDGSGTEHMVLLIRQSLTRSNDDTVTSVDTERVEVLHIANGDTVVGGIADDFVLNLLPALEGLLNQNLGGKGQRARRQVAQLLGVGSKTGAETTKSVGGTDDNGVADLLGGLEGVVNGPNSNRLGNGDVDLIKSLGEEITVLTGLQGLDAGTQNTDTVALKDTHAVHLHTQIQGGLTTKGKHDTIGLLALNDVGNIFGGYGQVVDLIGQLVVGLDSRNVGIDQDRLDVGLLEGLQSLGACIDAVKC